MGLIRDLFKKKKTEDKQDVERLYAGSEGRRGTRRDERRARLRRMLLPNGLNSKLLPYLIVNDSGQDVYYAALYIDKNFRRPVIASTYALFFGATGVTSTVYVHPLLDESIKRVNRRIDMLDAEQDAASGNRNRVREISGKIQNAENLARQLDSGDVSLFEVYFIFLVRAASATELRQRIMDLVVTARGKSMELSACYGAHLEGLMSSLPMNRLYPVQFLPGMSGKVPFRKHVFNEDSLSTIFNHTSSEFFHKEGGLIGYTTSSGMPFTFDPFDMSHFSYGVMVCGMPGYGKSATVKQIFTRLVDFDYYFATIDYESNGLHGEYAPACETVGGVNYAIGSPVGDKVNLFEINEETEVDEKTGREYRVLRVNDKVVDLTNILISIAMASYAGDVKGAQYEASELDRMQEIIMRTVQMVYAEFGIVEGDPDSLYDTSSASDGFFSSGRVRKQLPQVKDFYMCLVRASASNTDTFKNSAYALLKDKFYHRVKELYYCPVTLREFTSEDVAKMDIDAGGKPYYQLDGKNVRLEVIHGTSAYFDCQSTVTLDAGIPWYNFDISMAPETERPILILICQNFINENFIKRNSVDPLKAKKMIFSIDEFHRIKQPQAISFMAATYRTARKRKVSPWIITQSIADMSRFKEADEIIKTTNTLMLFKHKPVDRDALTVSGNLTPSQVDAVIELGGNDENNKRYGEMCIVDVAVHKVAFVKVHYLKGSEAALVETDTDKRAELFRQRMGQ